MELLHPGDWSLADEDKKLHNAMCKCRTIAKSRRRPKLHDAMCKCVKISNSRFVQTSKDLECDRPAWTKLDQIDSYDWPAWTNLDWLVSNCVFPLHSCMMSARLAQEGSAAYCGGVRALQYRNWIRTCAYVHLRSCIMP